MKAIKTLFLLIVLGLLGTLVYQNLEYFMTPSALHIDLKISTWNWTAPSLPNAAFWGICFGLGLLVTGIKGLFTAFRLGREIKTQEGLISNLKQEINDLKIRLDVFVHDPYIKQEIKTIAGGETVDKVVPSGV
ncbi:MAG: septum formation initiator family protein [Proteobacteria bacterium]|nr:septum formation initiator family protein [Pseudomonadota bacterium]